MAGKLWISATAVAVALLFFTPFRAPEPLAWLTLGYVIAFLMPVAWGKRGWQLRFTLPFMAAMAALGGPIFPLAVDLIATGADSLSRRRSKTVLARNFVLTVLSGSVAGLSIVTLSDPVVSTGVYALIHFAVNLYGAKLLDRRPVPLQIGGSEMLANLGMAYVVLAFAREVAPLVLLALIPLVGLRMFCEERNRAVKQQERTVLLLADLLQRAHPGTHRHLERCAQIAEETALRLGMNAAESQRVRTAAILHDIGKIAVDEGILDKPSKLTDEEFRHVKDHAAFGEDILKSSHALAEVRLWVRHHHETPTGTGYPDGLSGELIPLPSRIIAVVDAFDAMTGGIDGQDRRPYRDPMSVADAIAELDRCVGRQFDGAVVTQFKAVLSAGGIR